MSIKTLFEDIADAIREKSGSSDTYTPAEMPSAIRSIPSGSSTASGVSYENTASGLTANNVQDAIDELAGDVSTINSDLSELRSHVGLIIHSTTLDTEAKVKAIYGGTTWIQHSGYMLRGATSGVTVNDATKTGGEDSVTLTAAQSGVPAHKHSVNKITPEQGYSAQFAGGTAGVAQVMVAGPVYSASAVIVPAHNTNNNTAQKASQAHNNIPNYKSVYIWERTE